MPDQQNIADLFEEVWGRSHHIGLGTGLAIFILGFLLTGSPISTNPVIWIMLIFFLPGFLASYFLEEQPTAWIKMRGAENPKNDRLIHGAAVGFYLGLIIGLLGAISIFVDQGLELRPLIYSFLLLMITWLIGTIVGAIGSAIGTVIKGITN